MADENNVGSVTVDVKANLEPYRQGLQQARVDAQKFSQGAQQAQGGLVQATNQLTASVSRFRREEEQTNVATKKLHETFVTLRQSFYSQLGILPALAGVGGFAGIALAAQQAVAAFGAWEQQQLSFEGRLRATNGVIGLTGEQITSLARTINRETLTPIQSIQQVAIEMGRTGEITSDSLQRALRILPDLAMRTGDLSSASQVLTEALRNPANAYMKLRDAGIQFSQAQRDALEDTTTFTDRLENASQVLDILESQVGGEAAARGQGVTGGFNNLGDAVSDLTIRLGGALDKLLGFSEGARNTGDVIRGWSRRLFPEGWEEQLKNVNDQIEVLNRQITDLQSKSATPLLGGMIDSLTGLMGGGAGGALTAASQAELSLARQTREALLLERSYANAAQYQREVTEQQERFVQRQQDVTKGFRDQLDDLQGINRAQVRANQLARELGVNLDSAAGRRLRDTWQGLIQDIQNRNRALAQADRKSVFELENKRLREQLELFQFGNAEMRIHNQLNQIALRAERARQPLSQQQKETLEDQIRSLERIRQLSSTIESAFSSVFNTLGNGLADFAATGKLDFKALADSIVRDLVRIAIQAAVIQPLMQAITGITNPMAAGMMGGGGVGGVPGVPGVSVGMGTISGIPQFAEGGSFTVPGSGSGDRPALMVGLTPGEQVDITPAGKARGGGGGVTVVNNINSNREFSVSQQEREGPNGQVVIEQVFTEVMKKVGRGDGDDVFGARFGMVPRTVRR